MPDQNKTKEQLANELAVLRQQIVELTTLAAGQKEMERGLARLLEQSCILVTTHDVDVVLKEAIKSAVDIATAADSGSLQLLAEDGETLRTVAVSNSEDDLEEITLFRPGIGVAGYALASGKTVNVSDVLADEHFIPGKLPIRFRSLLVAPLVFKGQMLGTISLSSEQVGAFSTTDETLIQLIADQTAVAVENARLATARERTAENLRAIVAGIAAVTGTDFFRSLVYHLTATLGVRYAFVGELLEPKKDRLRTLAFRENGVSGENFEYCLVGSPCEKVVARGICYYPQHARLLFPKDKLLTEKKVECYLAAPLLDSVGNSLGFLVVMHDESLDETINAQAILSVFAARAGVELERHRAEVERERLLEAELRRSEELATLVVTSATVATRLEIDHVLQIVARQMIKLLGVEVCVISVWDQTANTITLQVEQSPQDWRETSPSLHPLKLADHLPARRVLDPYQPIQVCLDDVTIDTAERRYLEESKIKSLLVLPLVAADRSIGLVELMDRKRCRTFDDQEIALIQALANQAAVAIENARLFTETSEALAREQRLNEVAHAISSALDLSTILPNVVRLAAELVRAEAGALALISPDNETITYPYVFNLSECSSVLPRLKGHGVAWHIVETGESVWLTNYTDHPKALPYWSQAGAYAFIGVPVIAGQNCLGALILFNLSPDQQFSERDLALAESVGKQAGVAIQNARLYTEEQQRAEALATALARQEELDRLKNAFIRNVSHELRTPLTIARGYTELLNNGALGELQADQQKAVAVMTNRLKMLTDLVNDLIVIPMVEEKALRQEPVDLSSLVQSLVDDFQVTAHQAEVKLETEIAPDLPLISGDSIRLRQVIENLLNNALKFTPADGTVTVRIDQVGPNVALEVNDTGIGISPEHLERIFERFYQVDGSSTRRYGGTGLGLALVKEVVEAHGGQVTVESKVGEGSTFRIILPDLGEA